MDFYPNEPLDENRSQCEAWKRLKEALRHDEGVAYYRYPVFSGQGARRHEPDILLVHREYGIWVLECKGCRIHNIHSINGQVWQMRDWYREQMHPIAQADDQHWAVKNLVQRHYELRQLNLPFTFRVVLPFVTRSEWQQHGYEQNPVTRGAVWLAEDLRPATLRTALQGPAAERMPKLSDAQFQRLLGTFRGVVGTPPDPHTPMPTIGGSLARVVQTIEREFCFLDTQQERVASEIPPGPQRIRGLAGTGKTVQLAWRAAFMHARYPDWDIAFIFYTKSLYQMVGTLIEQRYREITDDGAPNWQKLTVWHAWGGAQQTGFYREAAKIWDARFIDYGRAQRLEPGDPFGYCCTDLEENTKHRSPFLDAAIIDEGQDLPPAFYRLVHSALRDPNRLYWGYDEAQGIGNLTVPRAEEIFGRDDQGRPSVDLRGNYPGGMKKSHIMVRCYRTPTALLTAAQAVNMGLLRKGGALQGITEKKEWEDLGYDIVAGDFSPKSVAAGKSVTIERRREVKVHPIDRDDFPFGQQLGSLLEVITVDSTKDMVSRIVAGIADDFRKELEPEHIMVVALAGHGAAKPIDLAAALRRRGVPAHVADGAEFRKPGHITVSGTFRAKGNEAWKVYACGLHLGGEPFVVAADEELRRRNEVYVALTRARVWCVGLGLKSAIMDELDAVVQQGSRLTFAAFNRSSLRRTIESETDRQEHVGELVVYSSRDVISGGRVVPVQYIKRSDVSRPRNTLASSSSRSCK